MKRHFMNKHFIACIGAALAISLVNTQGADKKVDVSKLPTASDAKNVTYAGEIKPIFEKSCIKCHGPEKQKG